MHSKSNSFAVVYYDFNFKDKTNKIDAKWMTLIANFMLIKTKSEFPLY